MTMAKVFLLMVLLLGCGGATDYSDAELLADSERQIEKSHHSYRLQRVNGGLIVSGVRPVRAANQFGRFQLTLSPAESVLLTGQLFSAVIYSPSRFSPKNNMLTLYGSNGIMHGQKMLAQWRARGNIFATTAKKQDSHMYANLFFLHSALLHDGSIAGIGGYVQDSAVQVHELSVAYSGRKLALAYRDKKEGIDMVINAELHQGRELIALDTLVVSPRGDVMQHLQSRMSG